MSSDATGIAISVHTTGSDLPASYQVAVNAGPPVFLETNGSASVSRLQAGTYTVALSIPSDNCTVAGGKLKNRRDIGAHRDGRWRSISRACLSHD